MQYFAIRRTDPCWKSIVDSGEVGVYVPAAIVEPELELKVVLPAR
jgi:predicted component of type VI protein secretion system